MANPQAESGHIRIANELWNEILRRDFSKRQQNLILFIWRLSYGTGQKDCKVDKFNLFELAGIHKQDVKNELNFLRDCSVLNWDEDTMIFSINKYYNLWQITPNKKWDKDKFNELIHQNLQRKKVSKTLTEQKQKVSKTLTFKSKLVRKIRTMRFVKYELTHDGNIVIPTGSTSLYPLLKTLKIINIKRLKEVVEEEAEDAVTFFVNNFGNTSMYIAESIDQWVNDFNSNEIVIASMKMALKNNANSFSYCEAILREWHHAKLRNIDAVRAYENNKRQKKNKIRSIEIKSNKREAPLPKSVRGEMPVNVKTPEEVEKKMKEIETLLNSL